LAVVVGVVAVGLLSWAGVALQWDSWLRRERRSDLTERLQPFQFDSVADEARSWLDDQP
jgi:hypothetical protein